MMQIIGIAALAIILVIALTPGLGSSIVSSITGQTVLCDNAPYNPKCTCTDDEEKLEVMAFGIPKHVCELKSKFINPDAPGWEQEAVAYAQDKLYETYPDCNSIKCTEGRLSIDYGWKNYNKRVINVECLTSQMPYQRLNHLVFYVEDGTVESSSCVDYPIPTQNTPITTISFLGTGPGYDMARFRIRTECRGIGTVDERYVYTLPETETEQNVPDWWFHAQGKPDTIQAGNGFYTCSLINPQPRSITIHCTGQCSSKGSIAAEITIRYDGDGRFE